MMANTKCMLCIRNNHNCSDISPKTAEEEWAFCFIDILNQNQTVTYTKQFYGLSTISKNINNKNEKRIIVKKLVVAVHCKRDITLRNNYTKTI